MNLDKSLCENLDFMTTYKTTFVFIYAISDYMTT